MQESKSEKWVIFGFANDVRFQTWVSDSHNNASYSVLFFYFLLFEGKNGDFGGFGAVAAMLWFEYSSMRRRD